jgi:putative membrane protein
MFDYHDLPTLNTFFNVLTTVLLLAGFRAIHHGKDVARHKRFMLSATATSACFLVGYLIYHAKVGSVPYTGEGLLRPVYFFILITHVVLAVVNVPLVVITLYRGLKDDRERHKKIARITFPIWLYVSVTGVIVYVMVHVFNG